MPDRQIAQTALDAFVQGKSQFTLSKTTFCALVAHTGDGKVVVVIATAGASAAGISQTDVDRVEIAVGNDVIVIPAAVPDDFEWDHINDAERQALRFVDGRYKETGDLWQIKVVQASRPICSECRISLGARAIKVGGNPNIACHSSAT
ncbi:hypothetical protein [Pseudomonas tohonis]|uniref:hypothetical protein n=1 Tax=Pseudomonas tohonis TaxID=2725477 RepID=UPI001F38C468|nr:hypothetical protein [Pseudomonas tohonis]